MKKVSILLLFTIIFLTGCINSNGNIMPTAFITTQNEISTIAPANSDFSITSCPSLYVTSIPPLDAEITEKQEYPILSCYPDKKSKIAEDSDYIYFCANGGGICKQSKKTKKLSYICSMANAKFLLIYNNIIYFVLDDDNMEQSQIWKMDKNGGNLEKIFDSENYTLHNYFSVFDFSEYKGNIYIQYSFELYEFNLNTRKINRISDDIENYHFYNGELYYTTKQKYFTIYKMDLSTRQATIVLGKGKMLPDKEIYSGFVFIGETMFAEERNPCRIYWADNNGKEYTIEKNDSNIFILTAIDNKIYYYLYKNNSKITKCYDIKTGITEVLYSTEINSTYDRVVLRSCELYLEETNESDQAINSYRIKSFS